MVVCLVVADYLRGRRDVKEELEEKHPKIYRTMKK